MNEIIPGILEKDWAGIEKKIEIAKTFAKSIHLDVLDGKFALNTTFLNPFPFSKYTLASSGQALFFEVHLMVDEPINYLKSFAEAGFKRFIGHVEKMSDQKKFVAEGKLLGEVGLAIDGPTSIDSIKVPLDDLDYLLIMTIKAGFSGQAFMTETLEKIKSIREKSAAIPIEVDGGINDQTIVATKKAGANRFSATSFIFKNQNPHGQFEILQDLVKE